MSFVNVIMVMGVSCTGKTTRGDILAYLLGHYYIEGDDHHPDDNIKKIANDEGLNDQDREPWLKTINGLAQEYQKKSGVVFTCSALKAAYRDVIRDGLGPLVTVYLDISKEEAKRRSGARQGHFAKEGLIDSQFADLEEPTGQRAREGDHLIVVPEDVLSALPASVEDNAFLGAPKNGVLSNEFEAAVTALYVVHQMQELGLVERKSMPSAVQICHQLALPVIK